jgi:phosphotransferase system HPr-like phosphotransfer protein
MQVKNKYSKSVTAVNPLSNDDFLKFISDYCFGILIMCKYITENPGERIALTRPYFGRMHLETTKIEEFLDAFGAKNNKTWSRFRKHIATMKTFSNVVYTCLHIKHSLNSYKLLEIKENFHEATDNILNLLYDTVANIASELYNAAIKCGLEKPGFEEKRTYEENLPSGCLTNDRKRRKVDSPEKNIVSLATKFLNFSEEIQQLDIYKKLEKCNYSSCIPGIVSEENLRWLENKFHNLQSLYDTHISDSNLESVDPNLPYLRGHATVIFHLLEAATDICHYYERHYLPALKNKKEKITLPISHEKLLSVLIDYSIFFSDQFLAAFHDLSKNILKDYTEEAVQEVPIPNYRGFHVRPSTLVSRIVNHYGSNVYVIFDNERFDAAKPLELFRINEKINALKRVSIAKKISKFSIIKENPTLTQENYKKILQELFLTLLEKKDLLLYESNFSFNDITLDENETLLELIKKAIARYLALGRIDITNEMKVLFAGDKRVLEDINILAQNGYGEDNYGNNIFLPKDLSYLRR